MSHFSYIQLVILLINSRLCFQTATLLKEIVVGQQNCHTWSPLELHLTSSSYWLRIWKRHHVLQCYLMSCSMQSFIKNRWISLSSEMMMLWPNVCLQHFGHTTAEDLKLKFEEVTSNLDTKGMVQVSMDGLNVNWKMLSKITEERSSTEHYHGLIHVGSCSLHVVHGAFRSGESKTKWGIDALLKALQNFLDECPAKREDYTKITGSDIFPLPFCSPRWLKDKSVAEKVLQIWPEITACKTLKKPKSQIPTLKTFSTVSSAVQDSLITAKLEFLYQLQSSWSPIWRSFSLILHVYLLSLQNLK